MPNPIPADPPVTIKVYKASGNQYCASISTSSPHFVIDSPLKIVDVAYLSAEVRDVLCGIKFVSSYKTSHGLYSKD